MSSSAKKITLKSSDGESFEVEEAVALESQTIKHMIEDDCADNGIPLPNVTSKILAKVIEYCKKHVDAAKPDEKVTEEELKGWDQDFVKVDQATLFDLILAANYLNIKNLLDLTCQTVADMIKGKTPEEIRKTFNIKNDFTPEEEEEVRHKSSKSGVGSGLFHYQSCWSIYSTAECFRFDFPLRLLNSLELCFWFSVYAFEATKVKAHDSNRVSSSPSTALVFMASRSMKVLKDAASGLNKTLHERLVCPLSRQPLRFCEETNSLISDAIGVSYPLQVRYLRHCVRLFSFN
ncbi:hypothetical protein ACLB2K_000951 [Fragaria x ananassa]